MKPFPDQHELIALFESEPLVTDAGVPWCYNHLTFTRSIGDSRIDCEIAPGFEQLKLRWFQRDVEMVNLDLQGVTGLIVESENGRETLIAEFRERSGLSPLRVQISPAIHISWGMTGELI